MTARDRRQVWAGVGIVSLLLPILGGLARSADHLPVAGSEPIAWHTDVNVAWTKARKQKQPLLILLSLEDCRYCRKMKTQTFTDPQLARRIRQGFVAVSLRARDHEKLVRKLGVEIYPTTAVISPEARLLGVIRGYADAEEVAQKLTSATRLAARLQRASRR